MIAAATIAGVLARIAAALFFLLTAVYALLVYVPFSYQQFILPDVVPGLSTLVAWHHVLFSAVVAMLAVAFIGDWRSPATRVRTSVFLAAAAGAAAYVAARPLLPGLRSDGSSLVVCLAALVPVLWMAALDIMSDRQRDDDEDDDRRVFATAAYTALFVSTTYFAIALSRAGVPAPDRSLVIALAWGVVSHLILFGGLFLSLLAIRGVVTLARGPAVMHAVVLCAFATALAALAVAQIALAAISFTGPMATIVAVAFALSLVSLFTGAAVRLRPLPAPGRWRGLVMLAAIAAAAGVLSARTAMMDWNYLLQKMSAIAVWVAAFSTVYAMRGRVHGHSARATAGGTIAWLLLAAAVPAAGYRALGMLSGDVTPILDAHAGFNPSFKIVYDALSPRADGDQREFYDLLQRNTNIPRAVAVAPVPVNLVDALAPRADRAPHVFIFVIDSLRQDYVLPYNSLVTFTPHIGAFAEDAVVFTQAFTRYGATGLSEPSIWTGGLLVHKQYVLPFAPMNALQKLLAADGYQRFISRDTILRTLMVPDEMDVELDAGVANMDYDLCRSLAELRSKILDPARPDRPIFAYTQPQNIHISRITREEGGAPGALPFNGFYAPYAARVQAIDACFGQFVQFLRDQRLYDDSVIILTSDHGDSLGEGGRWGHAYTIFPEILRIPLVVHLPRALQAQLTCDSDHVASLVDITPTLYYLLGHRPLVGGEIFGRPLCTATPRERIASRRDTYMVASSYGPVYGILRGNGRWLYIADGVNYTDYYYDLMGDPAGSQNVVTPAARDEYQQLIREGIDAVNRFYRPPS